MKSSGERGGKGERERERERSERVEAETSLGMSPIVLFPTRS